jgi:hypothetical protein
MAYSWRFCETARACGATSYMTTQAAAKLAGVQFRLKSPSLDFYVDLRLRHFDGRWMAVADIAGDKEMGLGRTARDALVASLASLGLEAVTNLLSDPSLFDVSRRVR